MLASNALMAKPTKAPAIVESPRTTQSGRDGIVIIVSHGHDEFPADLAASLGIVVPFNLDLRRELISMGSHSQSILPLSCPPQFNREKERGSDRPC